MLIPYTVDVPMARVPWANWALIGLTTLISFAIFVGAWSKPEDDAKLDLIWQKLHENSRPEDYGSVDQAVNRYHANRLPPLALARQTFSVLQLFSYLFVHADFFHLLGNMVFLFVFGNAVNAKLGHGLFVACYLLFGGLAGAAWLLLSSGPALVGASGAIMGLVGMFLVFYPRNDVQIYYMFSLAWTGEFRIPSGLLILFYMACDLVGTLWGGGGTVAYVAHVVGGLMGIGVAVGLIASGWFGADEGEENLLQLLGWQKKNKSDQDRYLDAKKHKKKKPRNRLERGD